MKEIIKKRIDVYHLKMKTIKKRKKRKKKQNKIQI